MSSSSRRDARSGVRRPDFGERLELWGAEGRVTDGLWIGVSNVSKRPDDEILARVESALTVIRTHDPRRYLGIRRLLRRIWVRLQVAGNLGLYNQYYQACELDLRYVLREDVAPADIASTIVHEATHARLAPLGYAEDMRRRVEAACRNQERAFAQRLPQAEGDRIRAKIEYWDKSTDDWWGNRVRQRQFVDGIPAALEYVGIPRWFAPALIFGRNAVAATYRVAGVLTRPFRRPGGG